MDSSSRLRPSEATSNNAGPLTKAERFEDEKRRIMSSCFAKQDDDGALLESYITHIRIIEDGGYPSSPPPPNSNPELKKPRLIIVAVRKSGRVRMHKARENANGSFSIGKTWVLDDLTAVEVFNSVNPRNPEDMQRAKWAGGKGFIVTIGKPYYWEATTSKEKQFFIASLVKIYTKYTGGKTPMLTGFEPKEKDALLLGASTSSPSKVSLSNPETTGSASNTTRERSRSRAPSREPPIRRKVSKETMDRQAMQPEATSSRPSTRSRREDSSGSVESPGGVTPQQSLPSLRKLASDTNRDPMNRQEDLSGRPPRSRGGLTGTTNVSDRFQDRNGAPTSQRAITPDSMKDINVATPAPLALPPERRRPIISEGYGSSENNIPAPLTSPALRRDEMRPPTRSNERPSPGTLEPTPVLNKEGEAAASDIVSPIEGDSAATTQETSSSVPESLATEESSKPKVDDRPGLGPMIKQKSKGDLASKLLMAASAATAFRPRAGGAAERLRLQQEKEKSAGEGPDGITGVVPAPSLLSRINSNGTGAGTADSSSIKTPVTTEATQEGVPEVKVITPQPPPAQPDKGKDVESSEITPSAGPLTPKSREPARSKQRDEQTQMYLDSLGIDASIFQGRGDEFSDLLDHYGWVGEGVHTKRVGDVIEEMRRDIDKTQVDGWLDLIDAADAKRQEVLDGLDVCMAECDELDNLLTLYNVELSTLAPDIAYIEAQAEGLQVQAANQKLLKAELDSLLETISISSDQLSSLREASLESTPSLEQIEGSLVMLYEAMIKIDPSLSLSINRDNKEGSVRSSRTAGISNSEIGGMRVVQEKKIEYKKESNKFLQRLNQFLEVKFSAAMDETRKALEREKNGQTTRRPGKARLDPRNHDLTRNALWKYSPIMLFSREINRVEWEHVMERYAGSAKPLYQDEFREFVFAWKRMAKKATGDEADLLFTSQIEKHPEGLATTARKLTVKRSQTLAKSLRSPIGDSGSRVNVDKIQDGRLSWYEVFAGIIEEEVPIILMEQNFIVEFFHASSLDQSDFPDTVLAAPPDSRYGGNIRQNKVMDPNRDLAKLVEQSMEDIYAFWPGDLQNLVDWALKEDPLQGVGVLVVLEKKMQDLVATSQEYLVRTLRTAHTRLLGLFNKFLEEQIRAIEDTKVKTKKRKGIIGFSRIFPSFSLSLETMLVSAEDLEIRETVNNAYRRILKTMFESLKFIARENPGVGQTGTSDLEDKEALNYEVLIIQNMNHFVEEVDARQNPVLLEWKSTAADEVSTHINIYVMALIRKPLKDLLDTIESTESVVLSLPAGTPPSSITNMPSHSKSTFTRAIATFDSKHVRRKAEELKKRVEKHFGEFDEPGSHDLINKVLKQVEGSYGQIEERLRNISNDVYGGEVSVDWAAADIITVLHK